MNDYESKFAAEIDEWVVGIMTSAIVFEPACGSQSLELPETRCSDHCDKIAELDFSKGDNA